MPVLIKCTEWKGESKIEGFTDYFEVNSFQFGVGRGISDARGSSKRESSIVNCSEIVVSKESDGASVKLFEEALHGPLSRKVEIAFVRQGDGNKPKAFIVVKLEGVGISGFSMSSGGGRPTESVTINYDKIEYSYDPVGDDLTGKPSKYSWDLQKAIGA